MIDCQLNIMIYQLNSIRFDFDKILMNIIYMLQFKLSMVEYTIVQIYEYQSHNNYVKF